MENEDLKMYLFGALLLVGGFFVLGGHHLVRYALADDAGKCQIRLDENDPDQFCDENNEIASKSEVQKEKAAEAEKLRRSQLSPYERCREDLRNRSYYADNDPDIVAYCKQDGTVGHESISDTLAEVCEIKGNISIDTGEKIYHVPGQEFYESTVINSEFGERYFCTEQEAVKAGWRRSLN